MGTTAEKLQKALDSKNAIKQAIIDKGGNVGDVMSEYASAIENLSTGLDTSDATATSEDILLNKTAYVKNKKITGTMPYRGTVVEEITQVHDEIPIAQGYHEGSGYVSINYDEQTKIIPQNIKMGISILGVIGTCELSSNVTAHIKKITPSTVLQTVLPDSGYDYLSQVTVEAIPYAETDNASGGVTVTIA